MYKVVVFLVLVGTCMCYPPDMESCEDGECHTDDYCEECSTEHYYDEDETTTMKPGSSRRRREEYCEDDDCDHDKDETTTMSPGSSRRRRQTGEGTTVKAIFPIRDGDRVCFTVRRPSDRSTERLQFTNVLTNIGGAWNRRESQFVAPFRGCYFFTYHAVSEDDDQFSVSLMLNGRQQVTAYGGGGDNQHGANSVVLSLRRGDRVYLELQDGSLFQPRDDSYYNTFTGFLIYRS